jgi:short-subunit dehydrogenase
MKKLKLPIVITDVQPGFVDTRMAGGEFWMASAQKAARQIAQAISRKKEHLYVTKRLRLIAWLLKVVPDALYSKLG